MFRVPQPAEQLAFTGERMTTAISGQIAFEHLHRYCIARDLCAGKDVLDVASGEGYGPAILAGVARQVVGVDIDDGSVRHARRSYNLANLSFVQGDAHHLPLPDACCDVAVSFETLEHVRDQHQFLREIRRVLRPGGIFIVSTPDRLVYSAPGQKVNPFHVAELTLPELQQQLGALFAHQRVLRQRCVLGSVVVPLDRADAWRSYDHRDGEIIESASGFSRAFYLIGIASDVPLPAVGGSAYCHGHSIDGLFTAAGELPKQIAAVAQERARCAELQSRIAELQGGIEELQGRTEELTGQIAQLARANEAACADWQRQIEHRNAELEHARAGSRAFAERVAVLEHSTWWRLGAPLRSTATRFPRATRTARRAVRTMLRRDREEVPPPAPPAVQMEPQPRSPADPIELPFWDNPVVSVIVPCFGKFDYTHRCLASIAAHPPTVPIEVIVVDDASGDPAIADLRAVKNLRLEVWPENLGFLRSCNAAAALARGTFLMLLNNDTEVTPGAIDHLHQLLAARADAGMAGARLLFPDGTQQEAGGIIWRDGSGWNYGRDDDPRKPEYNYVREVDYVSGAAIMLPRAVWDHMGGFDEAFAPAYYEDADLAFRLRAAGLKVLYQPAATVVHMRGRRMAGILRLV